MKSIGHFTFDPTSGQISRGADCERLEPKVADLLDALAERPGEILSRDEISARLWPDVVVGEDALPRCVSKLRRAFADDARNPRYIETVPKRGYRLIAAVGPAAQPEDAALPDPPAASEAIARPDAPEAPEEAPGAPDTAPAPAPGTAPGRARRRPLAAVWVIGGLMIAAVVAALVLDFGPDAGPQSNDRETTGHESTGDESTGVDRLVDRADDFYVHITRSGNESAIALYERALAAEPEHARAHAGLANALVQRVLRYYPALELERVDLGSALASGRLQSPEALMHLERAHGLAERAVRLDPDSAAALKALGFVTSALGRLEQAEQIYRRAVELDPDAWDVWINLGDIHSIRGEELEALRDFELAYGAMERVYAEQPQRVGPWLAELGALIGDRHVRAGQPGDGEIWLRRVLVESPLHPGATCALADLLAASGDEAAARRLRAELLERLGESFVCAGEEDP